MPDASACVSFLRKVHAKDIQTDEYGKAKSFRLISIARPFMRGFHTSWFCFFIAFTTWFGLQPLVPTIMKDLGLTKKQVANSGTASIAATIAVRVVVGPLCDKFGPRRIMSGLLIFGAIPMALSGLVKSETGLIIIRLCIGIIGGCFVPCQFWTTSMFNAKIVGTANALVGGWGNLGGGFTFIFMPGIFELVKICGANEFLAWKIAVAVPSVICVITGVSIIFTSDDCPQGKWENRKIPGKANKELKDDKDGKDDNDMESSESQSEGVENAAYTGTEDVVVTTKPVQSTEKEEKVEEGKKDTCGLCSSDICWMYLTTIVLVIQYGMCFGVEIAVNTVMNLYFIYNFKNETCVAESLTKSIVNNTSLNNSLFGSNGTTATNQTASVVSGNSSDCSILDQNTASLIASLFGLMNLFARALGGLFSDFLRKRHALPGRILAHFICLTLEGLALILFSTMKTIASALVVMIFFSICVQMSEGTTYAIVPYIMPRHVGIVAGCVGAGGNAGALIWSTIWAQLVDTEPSRWFWLLGVIVLCGSSLSSLIAIQKTRIWNLCRCFKETSYEVNN